MRVRVDADKAARSPVRSVTHRVAHLAARAGRVAATSTKQGPRKDVRCGRRGRDSLCSAVAPRNFLSSKFGISNMHYSHWGKKPLLPRRLVPSARGAGRGGARRGGAGKSGGRGPARLTLHGFASGEGGLAASDSEGEWTRKQRRRGLRLGRPEPDPGGGGPGGDAQGSAAGCDYGTLLGARGLELELRARSGLGGCVGPRPASGSLAGQEQSLSPGAEASGVLEASWARPGGLAVGRRSVCRWYPSP